jgi:hypothetical protein
MKTVLIFSPTLDQSYALALVLKSKGYHITAACFPEEKLLKPKCYDEVISVTETQLGRFDWVIPTGASSTHWLASIQNQIVIGKITYKKDNLRVFEKIWMLELAKRLKVLVPQTYTSQNKIKEFPIFYKQKFEQGGGIRGIAFNKNTLQTLPDQEHLIYQEYIPGNSTYGVGFLAKDGKLLTTFIHKEILSFPKAGGSAAIIQIYKDERLINYTEKMIKALNYSGWGLAEFKYCPKRQDFVFMEINAKFWASIEFALINNPKFVDLLFGIKVFPQPYQGAVYLDRLISLGAIEFIINLKYLFQYRLINHQSILKIIFVSILPEPVKRFLKTILKK